MVPCAKQKKTNQSEITRQQMDEVYKRVVNSTERYVPFRAGCLYASYFLVKELSTLTKQPVLIQAGTAFWPRVYPVDHSKVFGYLFSPDTRCALYLALGQLPEMHCWVVLPETQQLIDLTTGEWPNQCLHLQGVPWEGQRPPKYYWDHWDNLPEGVEYEAHANAIKIAFKAIRDLLGHRNTMEVIARAACLF